MLRLTFMPSDFGYRFMLVRDGTTILNTADAIEVAERLLQLGIENPLHLIQAARQWGVVEIRQNTAT